MLYALIQDFFQSLEWWEKIFGALVGLGISFLSIAKAAKFFWSAVSDANKFANNIVDLVPDLKKIAKEFKPNGGSSLKDILCRLENHLAHTDQKIRVVASCIGISAFEADKFGLYTFVSKQWSDVTGFNSDQAQGNGWINVIEESEREELFKEWQSCIEQNREFHASTKLINGQETSIIAWPIRNLDGSVEKFFGMLL
ncbi:MAG: hypothetical protein RLZ10_943 [Bacteroidota bacterium]|jgi:PAS domain-containing protein